VGSTNRNNCGHLPVKNIDSAKQAKEKSLVFPLAEKTVLKLTKTKFPLKKNT